MEYAVRKQVQQVDHVFEATHNNLQTVPFSSPFCPKLALLLQLLLLLLYVSHSVEHACAYRDLLCHCL